MIEIWQECESFLTTSQRLADQVRTIIKKDWFSGLEIHQKTNNEQDSNTISDTPSINKQEQSNRNEPATSENRNTAQPNNTQHATEQHRANTNTKIKNKFLKFKEDYEWNTHFIITKNHRM